MVLLSDGTEIELRKANASDFLFINATAEREKEPTATYKAIARLVIKWGDQEKIGHEAIANLGRRDIRSLKDAIPIFNGEESGFNELEVEEAEDGGLTITLSDGEILSLRDSTGRDERLAGEFATVRNPQGKTERNDYRYILYLFGLLSGHEGREGFNEFCAKVPFSSVMGLVQIYNQLF